MKKFLIALTGVTAGMMLIRYRESVYRFTGKNSWAERVLGQGGTITILVIVGCASVVLSILYLTGALDILLANTIGKLFKFQLG